MKTSVAVLLLSVSGCAHTYQAPVPWYSAADVDCYASSLGSLDLYRGCMADARRANHYAQQQQASYSGPSAGQVAGSILQGMGQGIQQAQARQTNCYTQYAGNQAFTHCQ